MTIDRLAPAERPRGRSVVGYQSWRELLFLHWELPAATVAATLPAGLELDTFEGRALVGAVAFTMRGVRPWWSPRIPGVSDFHELNVRTYVLCGGEPGVWFYSLDAASSLAVRIARWRWHLPYHRATMRIQTEAGGRVAYTSTRRFPPPVPAAFHARYRTGAARGVAVSLGLEHFLVERYLLFAADGHGGLRRGQVHHRPYPLSEVELESVEQTVLAAAGFDASGPPSLVTYSPGVDVEIFALMPVTG